MHLMHLNIFSTKGNKFEKNCLLSLLKHYVRNCILHNILKFQTYEQRHILISQIFSTPYFYFISNLTIVIIVAKKKQSS